MAISAVIVDDEQLAREELAFLLKEADVEVVAQGKNGVEAVNLTKEMSPDILFLDVQMPDLTASALSKNCSTANSRFRKSFSQRHSINTQSGRSK